MNLGRMDPLSKLDTMPRRYGVLLLVFVAALPHLLRGGWGFLSDDWLLLASVEDDSGPLGGLGTHLTEPYFRTWLFNLYMPLFSWSISLEARLFGADPTGYFVMNVAYFAGMVALAYLAGARLVGRGAALLGALLLAVNPWTVNNVSWMVGRCSTVSAAFIFGGIILYYRWRDSGEKRFPIALLLCVLVGVFYRQTTLFLPVFIALIDVVDGRHSWRRLRLWAVLSSPVLLYVVACYFVLGAWSPNYGLVQAISGNVDAHAPGILTQVASTGRDLLLPARSDAPGAFDAMRWIALWLISLTVLLGVRRLADRRTKHWLLLMFVFAHGAPLFWKAGWVIEGESAQRWLVVSWALMLFVVEFCRRSFLPIVSVACILALASVFSVQLDQNLRDYGDAVEMSDNIQRAIAEAPEEIVFVNNMKASFGPAPFFTFGLGATQLPPFNAHGKRVYPIMKRALYARDIYSQVPIGCVLPEYGTACSTLWVDYENKVVIPVNPASQLGARAIFDQIPRLELISPVRDATAFSSLKLRLDARGAERVDVHVLTASNHVYFHRVRGQDYDFGRFMDDGTFVEDLWPELQMATFQDGAADGRCYLWVLTYKDADVHIPMAASEFIELRSTAEQEKRRW